MKSILHVCAFGAPNPGNFIPSLYALEKTMSNEGYETIYALPCKAMKTRWCEDLCKDHKVYFLPEENARILPNTYKYLKKIYSENDIRIVHSHFELYDIPATVMAPKGVKVFWHLHDAIKLNYYSTTFLKKILYRIQYGLVGKRAKLLTVSKEHGDFAVQLGFKKESTIFVPNGINTERIKKTSQKNDNIFLMFGWEVERKGVDIAVKAAQHFNDGDFKIKIVGQETCEQYLKNHPNKNVEFTFPKENVNDLFDIASCFLHISRAEGMSYALIEAVYAGLRVICSDIPENEFAGEFNGVLFVETGKVDSLVSAINEMRNIQQIDDASVGYNRKIISSKYSLSAWSKAICDIYNL